MICCLLLYHIHCAHLTNINGKVLLNAMTYDAHHCQSILISQYFSIWSFWNPFSFSLTVCPETWTYWFNYHENLDLFSIYAPFRIQSLDLVNLIWYLSIETPLRQFVFFSSAIASPLPPTLLWIAYLTSLLNMFWAIQQALFFLPILRKFAKLKKTNQTKKQQRKTKNKTKKPQRDKVVGLQH